jgi:hypothetical protein
MSRRAAGGGMMTDDAKKARDLRRHLRDLTAAVAAHLEEIDREMRGPARHDRGRRIAVLCNRLNLANDMAQRFGLGVGLGKPRPVVVDDGGHIFEVDGKPLIVAGLEPGAVLAGLADLRSGRVRPLKDVSTRRPHPRKHDT